MHTSCLITHLVLCAVQPALEQLAFQNVGCSINACTSLAELLQNTQELRNLRLYNNMSDDAGAAAIAKVDYVSSQHLSPAVPTLTAASAAESASDQSRNGK